MTNVYGGAGPGDWCTPKWIAELLGRFDLDPCSNPRSHIRADDTCSLEDGTDGLATLPEPYYDVFINPPYGRGEVIKWVRHYRRTRFTFLLKWAPDTQWFRELIPHCTHVWHPFERIEFEPPPGTSASSNPFPHALYMREPPEDRLKRLATRGLMHTVDIVVGSGHATTHDKRPNVRASDDGEQGAGAARGGSGGEAARATSADFWRAPCTHCYPGLCRCPVFPIS